MRHLLLGIALAACAPRSGQGPTTPPNATAGANPNLICREETPTGTSISRTVCRTPEQIEDDRRKAEEFYRMQALRPIRLPR